MKRLKGLDVLRGLMSLNVILCHFICAYYPEMYTLSWTEKYARGDGTGDICLLSVVCAD